MCPPTPTLTDLLRVQLSPRVEMIEVQDCVEHERIGADCLSTIDRVVRKQDYMSLLHWDIHDDRSLCNIASAIEQARNQQVALIGESQRNTRSLIRRDDRQRVAQLFISDRCRLPRLDGHA